MRSLCSCSGDFDPSADKIDDPRQLPTVTTPSQIEPDPRLFEAIQFIACILESLGYAGVCAHGSVERSGRTAGHAVRVAWRRLRSYVEYERERSGSQRNWEWFECLAEQVDRHSKARTSLTLGAQEAYRDWRP
jgi:hypothetical protein